MNATKKERFCKAIPFVLCMLLIFCMPQAIHADEENELHLSVADGSEYGANIYLEEGETWEGVSFDAKTNTLTLRNAILRDATFSQYGTDDLKVIIEGQCFMYGENEYASAFYTHEEAGDAGIIFSGSGSLVMHDYPYGAIIQDVDTWLDEPKNGDIVIDGVTLLFENCSAISSNYSNVIIKNGAYVRIDGKDGKTFNQDVYGLFTGRTYGGFDRTGKLSISDSELMIMNCGRTLAYNRLDADGIYFYTGDESAEYRINMNKDPEREYLYSDTYRSYIFDCSYFEATPENKNLPYRERITDIRLSRAYFTYDGKVKKPTVTAYNKKGNKLEAGKDYEVTYDSGRKEIGYYGVTVKFKGKYCGDDTLYFDIVPKKVANLKAKLSKKTGGYNDVVLSWKASKGATGYMVYYKKASAKKWSEPVYVKKGTSFTKKDLAAGTKYKFAVVPYGMTSFLTYSDDETAYAYATTLKKVTMNKLKKSGSKIKVSWKDINGESGYQIARATKKNGKYTIIVKSTKANAKSKLVKAEKGKKYYYKVRAYKLVDGKKVFGLWSTPKYIKR